MSAEISASFLAITLLLGTIVVGTIIGNLFVIIAILVDKNLQTPANQLVLSLACSDLMVACLVMPLGAYNDLNQGWFLGKEVCEFWTSADVLCCTASILHLLAIALDRYWAVTNADYIYRRTRARMHTMIVCAWTVGLIVSLAPIFGWKDPDFGQRVLEKHMCLVSQDVGYQLFATISSFYAPLVLLLALYWRIFQVALKRIRRKPGAAKALGASVVGKQPQELAIHQTGSRNHHHHHNHNNNHNHYQQNRLNYQSQVLPTATLGPAYSPDPALERHREQRIRSTASDKQQQQQPKSEGHVIEESPARDQVELNELDANQLAALPTGVDQSCTTQLRAAQEAETEVALATKQLHEFHLASSSPRSSKTKSNGLLWFMAGGGDGSLKKGEVVQNAVSGFKHLDQPLGRRRRHTEFVPVVLQQQQTRVKIRSNNWVEARAGDGLDAPTGSHAEPVPKQGVSGSWRRQWRRLSEAMGVALRIDASRFGSGKPGPHWETSGLEVVGNQSCRKGQRSSCAWPKKVRRRVVVPVEGTREGVDNGAGCGGDIIPPTYAPAGCVPDCYDASHVVTSSGHGRRRCQHQHQWVSSQGSGLECQHCLRMHHSSGVATKANGDQLCVIEAAGGTCGCACDCNFYSNYCSCSFSQSEGEAEAYVDTATGTCPQCNDDGEEPKETPDAGPTEINHGIGAAGHAYLAAGSVIVGSPGGTNSRQQEDKRHFSLLSINPPETGQFCGGSSNVTATASASCHHKIDEAVAAKMCSSGNLALLKDLALASASADSSRRQHGQSCDLREEDNASEASSLSGPFPSPLAGVQQHQQHPGSTKTRNGDVELGTQIAIYDRLSRGSGCGSSLSSSQSRKGSSGPCDVIVSRKHLQTEQQQQQQQQQHTTLTLYALNSIAQPETVAVGEKSQQLQTNNAGLGLKRKFKALGQLVSFVQTSRNFNSCSSSSGGNNATNCVPNTGQSSSMSGEVDEEEAGDECGGTEYSAEGTTRTEQMQEDTGPTTVASSINQTQQTVISGASDIEHRSPTPCADPIASNKGRKSLAGDKISSQANELASASRRVSKRCSKGAVLLQTGTDYHQPTNYQLQQQQHQQVSSGVMNSQALTQRGRRENMDIKREKKAAKTLAIITGVFVCCWLPFFLNAIIMPICGQNCTPSDLVLSILLWLGYLNSLLNPIIYTIFSPDFRRAFRRLLCWPAANQHQRQASVKQHKKPLAKKVAPN